jgi:hypothetical protein
MQPNTVMFIRRLVGFILSTVSFIPFLPSVLLIAAAAIIVIPMPGIALLAIITVPLAPLVMLCGPPAPADMVNKCGTEFFELAWLSELFYSMAGYLWLSVKLGVCGGVLYLIFLLIRYLAFKARPSPKNFWQCGW